MMLARAMMTLSAAVILLLGVLHLLYTFVGTKLVPRDDAVRSAMEGTSPGITRQTTMWKAWVGFNASHALGAMLFGLLYGYLALAQPGLLFASPVLLSIGGAFLAAYVVLGRRYWFRTPFVGILVASVLYVLAMTAVA